MAFEAFTVCGNMRPMNAARGTEMEISEDKPYPLARRGTRRARILLSFQPMRRGSRFASSTRKAAARLAASNCQSVPTKFSTAT